MPFTSQFINFMKKTILFIFSFLSLALLAQPALAVCPVCTVAVVAGVGLSRWLGIDDTVTGIWIGGLTVSIIAWTLNWLSQKQYNFFGRQTFTILGWYAIIVLPLAWMDILGHPLNKLWGIDKLVLGIMIGSLSFFAGDKFCCWLKKRNDGKAHFPFQKVAIPVLFLIITSFIFYFITK
jgi:hypothetical protein